MPQEGHTSLHYAASEGHEAAIKVLLAAKAGVQAKDNVRGGEGLMGERGGGDLGSEVLHVDRSFPT